MVYSKLYTYNAIELSKDVWKVKAMTFTCVKVMTSSMCPYIPEVIKFVHISSNSVHTVIFLEGHYIHINFKSCCFFIEKNLFSLFLGEILNMKCWLLLCPDHMMCHKSPRGWHGSLCYSLERIRAVPIKLFCLSVFIQKPDF